MKTENITFSEKHRAASIIWTSVFSFVSMPLLFKSATFSLKQLMISVDLLSNNLTASLTAYFSYSVNPFNEIIFLILLLISSLAFSWSLKNPLSTKWRVILTFWPAPYNSTALMISYLIVSLGITITLCIGVINCRSKGKFLIKYLNFFTLLGSLTSWKSNI